MVRFVLDRPRRGNGHSRVSNRLAECRILRRFFLLPDGSTCPHVRPARATGDRADYGLADGRPLIGHFPPPDIAPSDQASALRGQLPIGAQPAQRGRRPAVRYPAKERPAAKRAVALRFWARRLPQRDGEARRSALTINPVWRPLSSSSAPFSLVSTMALTPRPTAAPAPPAP